MTQETYPPQVSATKRLVEASHPGLSVEALLRGYDALGWTQGRIAVELGVSRATVNRWYRAYNIQAARGRRVA